MRPARLLWVILAAAAVSAAACGGDDGASSNSSPASASPTRPNTAERLLPPFEGPDREAAPQRQDWRLDPNWRLPSPATLPTPNASAGAVLHPPAQATCPGDWRTLERPAEGFKMCYPAEWKVARQGYVTSSNEESWFAAAIFDFPDQTQAHQLAHVSVYVIPRFTRPPRYTIDCAQKYAVQLAGHPAVVCPDFPGTAPEARIISYNVFANDVDYFVTVATYYDTTSSPYPTATPAEALATALQIVGTFQVFTPQPTATERASGSGTHPASATPTPTQTATSATP